MVIDRKIKNSAEPLHSTPQSHFSLWRLRQAERNHSRAEITVRADSLNIRHCLHICTLWLSLPQTPEVVLCGTPHPGTLWQKGVWASDPDSHSNIHYYNLYNKRNTIIMIWSYIFQRKLSLHIQLLFKSH